MQDDDKKLVAKPILEELVSKLTKNLGRKGFSHKKIGKFKSAINQINAIISSSNGNFISFLSQKQFDFLFNLAFSSLPLFIIIHDIIIHDDEQ